MAITNSESRPSGSTFGERPKKFTERKRPSSSFKPREGYKSNSERPAGGFKPNNSFRKDYGERPKSDNVSEFLGSKPAYRKPAGNYSSSAPRSSYGERPASNFKPREGYKSNSERPAGGFKPREGGFQPRESFRSSSSERPSSSFKPREGFRSNSERPSGGFKSREGNYPPRRSFGGGERKYGNSGSSNRGRGGRRFAEPSFDLSLFVNKAVIKEESAEVAEHTFSDFGFSNEILRNIEKKNYVTPTPIQDKTIKLIVDGKDVIGIANTGTGKTGAFLLPLIDKLVKNKNQKVLVIAPTRELAQQINDEFREFSVGLRQFSVLCVGGKSINNQIFNLRREHSFVIGTPGRIKDLYNRRALNLGQFENIVLDEVDRMLDMGFLPDVEFILSKMKEQKQSLFFSATIPKEVEGLMGKFLNEPIRISVKKQDTAESIEQDIVKIDSRYDKVNTLHDYLIKPDFSKVLVFVKTKRNVDNLEDELLARGFSAVAIHGDKPQNKRFQAISDFKIGKASILIATDVAARGLDIPKVTHVINYDMPSTYEDYVHRIGRTGRGSHGGMALTFVDEASMSRSLKKSSLKISRR